MSTKGNNKFINHAIIRSCKFVHLLMVVVAFIGCLDYYNTRFNDYAVGDTRFTIFVGLYILMFMFCLRTYKAYDFGLTERGILVYSQTLSAFITDVVFYIVFVVANSKVFNPLPLAVLFVIQILINSVWTIVVNGIYFKLNKPKKTIILYREESELIRLKEIYSRKKNFKIADTVKYIDGDDWTKYIENCEAVFVVDLLPRYRNSILKYCIEKNIHCYTAPYTGDIIMRGAKYLNMFSVPAFEVSRVTPNVEYLFFKRLMDIVLSLLGIIVLSPIMVITAIAIRLYDKGPAFYRQVRLTKNGKEFRIFKFRSMRVNAESDGVARLATDNDDRITPIGRVIRACRLDELPQLFNILKGDMSIVGPRPERPEIAVQYLEELPEFNLRLQVKAGLTGLAQVYGRYNTEPADKLQMDLMYINDMSIIEDIKLVLATIKILFIKESTSGTAEGQITAMASKTEQKK
ncbi:MAG: exopolysaccharide biosynthesis polyprenyl glycosylphosphotransferase [Clostridia bacterium]|nr:exopolysaccharide biosynthesis polyprenyl glycosylphosphotransferase [Clostridia bacterium]